MHRLRGTVQHYDWGDPTAIPQLLGEEPDGRPWAELWFGTHPRGPTTMEGGGDLRDVSGDLPYLVKLLAAGEPLSLQTHPTDAQALEGFTRENDTGIALDAPARTYRDPNAKPELLCALTPFEALCGFRPTDESAVWFAELGWHDLAARLASGPEDFVRWALTAGPHTLPDGAPAWTQAIAARHPGDGGVLVALLLNHVELEPGQAVFLEAGNLHAYLGGVAVEVMGASDNVVRGGLTSKHVDVDELLAVVDLAPLADPVLRPREASPGEWRYDTPATPFAVWRWEITMPVVHVATSREVLVCTAGDTGPVHAGEAVYLAPGEAIELRGLATVYGVGEPPITGG